MNVGTKNSHAPQDIASGSAAVPRVVPDPIYRHAAPSGPWPWMNLNVGSHTNDRTNSNVPESWQGYPQNKFRNWTTDQVKRSKMFKKCSTNQVATIYWMDVHEDGKFAAKSDVGGNDDTTVVSESTQAQDQFWTLLSQKRPKNIRVRSLFVDDLTESVLRMLGTKYDIEPFFFTSSINWIPSRYQEALRQGKGDHITITLPFLRPEQKSLSPRTRPSPTDPEPWHFVITSDLPPANAIDIQAPFSTRDGRMLFIDLLAVHMVRDEENTIISYHPESTGDRTSAKHLHSLIQLVGESVYWQKIFNNSKDPTFLLLAILWYALYEWDESLDLLYSYVSELERQVLHLDNISLTHDLHVLEARLLHYQSLLHGFEVSVKFLETTPNPAMESHGVTDEERRDSDALMKKECNNLLSEIDRLERRRTMLSSRLKNAMDLAFAIVNAEDSRRMQRFSYLTLVFLPAGFIAAIFTMNIKEINNGTQTLGHYVVATVSLTLLTIYVVVVLQRQNWVHRRQATFLQRVLWPIHLILRKIIFPLHEMWVRQYRGSPTDASGLA
ncbi:cora-like Mg2+ transporter protein-domain-containing protein [Suillus subalutaceus]|uniref:cora-like Mg2+ transporter protein-domain-containing protein n=1 Tax=Suillus subalutaceus TaxID=48586 RepID=UPI001B861528|nr:cora-like Mg2+ transporter protein-domain-containing protein [Suillus subalutaceus]KAG1851576.1 cora-like Mg2+ transporter protein-domain-containing protein [Suillus subalutaceus]